MAGVMSVTPGWATNTTEKLIDLWKERESTADITIHIGDKQIPAHRTIVDMNSEFTNLCDTTKNGSMTDVFIDPQFGEDAELIERIISSFYSGIINLEEEDLKVTYKFSRNFTIKWLVDYVRKRLQDTLNAASFLDIFTFANSIVCETLTMMCLEYLDSNVADALVESGDLMKMDFYCITKLTLLDNSMLPEMKVFDMVRMWFEHDVEDRKCHIEQLLSNIRFPLITSRDDLDRIQDWIVNTDQGIVDKTRIRLLSGLMRKRTSDGELKQIQIEGQDQNVRRIDVNNGSTKLLRTIIDFIKKKGTSEGNDIEPISPEQYAIVLREKFSKSDSYTKHCILEYMSDHLRSWPTLYIYCGIDRAIVNLQEYGACDTVTKLIDIATSGCMRFVIRSCLTDVSYDVLHKIISKTVDWGSVNWIYAIAAIMRWAYAHQDEVTKIPQLFETAVCVCDIPEEYKNLILLPHLRKLLNDNEYQFQLDCRMHVNGQRRPNRYRCHVNELSEGFYLLKKDHSMKLSQLSNCYLRLDITSTKPLMIQSMNRDCSWPADGSQCATFILFNKNKCMEHYPKYSKYSNLSLAELRKMFFSYNNLCVMTLKLHGN